MDESMMNKTWRGFCSGRAALQLQLDLITSSDIWISQVLKITQKIFKVVILKSVPYWTSIDLVALFFATALSALFKKTKLDKKNSRQKHLSDNISDVPCPGLSCRQKREKRRQLHLSGEFKVFRYLNSVDSALAKMIKLTTRLMLHGIIIRIVINNPSQMIYDV